MSDEAIHVRGARTHNLRDLDVRVPSGRLVVLSGPSGSGKSSLAFDTIHAESARRLASVSEGAASVVADAPDVDAIDGLGVTVALSQRAVLRSARSSVATLAGVAEPVRRLFAARARPTCLVCGGLGVQHEVGDVVQALLEAGEGTRVIVLAPIADGAIGDGAETLASLARAGFVRARIDGSIVALADVPRLDPKKPHRIDVVVDRATVRASERDRLREAVELAYRSAAGRCLVTIGDEERRFSASPVCASCGADVLPLEPGAFRRTDPRAACPTCAGSGLEPVAPRRKKGRVVDDEEEGAPVLCPECGGLGVGPRARGARVGPLAYDATMTLAVAALLPQLVALAEEPSLRPVRTIVDSILGVLRFLIDVGLGHLTLARRSSTLSTGEASRARLAGVLANQLVGVTYVLDEPTAGLHPRERAAILDAMRRLVARGDTVICVEHDADVLAAADWRIELGPGAGGEGGSIVREGPPPPRAPIHEAIARRVSRARSPGELVLDDVRCHPFEGARLRVPLGSFTFLTGPSGSGKSTLLACLASTAAALRDRRPIPSCIGAVRGFEHVGRVARLDDTTSIPGPRSLVATRLEIFGPLRELFAALPEARTRGFDAARFGLGATGGRCEACEGRGRVVVTTGATTFELPCDRCGGTRYDESMREVRYRGASIVDVLASPIVDALARFEAIPALARPLAHAARLGLGHLELGRGGAAVSGGEATRLRLAAELARRAGSDALVLLDEPCRGLHPSDVDRLVDALDELASRGATVVVAEHAIEAIAQGDYVVDLDVDGARSFVAAEGSPAEIAAGTSPTAPWLARSLPQRPDPRA